MQNERIWMSYCGIFCKKKYIISPNGVNKECLISIRVIVTWLEIEYSSFTFILRQLRRDELLEESWGDYIRIEVIIWGEWLFYGESWDYEEREDCIYRRLHEQSEDCMKREMIVWAEWISYYGYRRILWRGMNEEKRGDVLEWLYVTNLSKKICKKNWMRV